MEDTRHFRARLAGRAGKGHGQGGLNGIGRETKIVISGGELTLQLEAELIGGAGREIEIGGAQGHKD